MKRLLEIIILVIFSIHFIGNVFVNIIGVPLAAYQSYETWKEVEVISDSLQKKNKDSKTKRKIEYNKIDSIPKVKK